MRRRASGVLLLFALSGGLGRGQARADSATNGMSLSEAYRQALRQSEQVEVAVGNRDIADTTYTQQLTIMGPTVSARLQGQRQNNARGQAVPGLPANLGLQAPYAGAVTVTAIQPLFRRQIFDARRAAALGIEGAEQQLLRAKQQLMFDVATVFIAVLQARTQVVIAGGAIKRADSQLAAANKKSKAGAAVLTAVLLAQIELNRAQTSVNTAEGALKQQQSMFERLIGVQPPAVLELPPTPSQVALTEAMTHAPHDRADLRALHFQTLQARALVSQFENTIFWPTLDATLTAGYIVQASSSGNADFRYPTYGITGTFTVPLFQTGNEWIQVKLQKERAYIAAYQESFLRRQVGDDVREALAGLETANKAIEIATEQQRTAERNYQLVSVQYTNGAASSLDVLTAQGAVFEAETNKAQSQYQREIAVYQLLFAEGKIQL